MTCNRWRLSPNKLRCFLASSISSSFIWLIVCFTIIGIFTITINFSDESYFLLPISHSFRDAKNQKMDDWESNQGTTNNNFIVVIDGQGFSQPSGGIEAMIQLSIALALLLPDSIYITKDAAINNSSLANNHDRNFIVYHEKYIHAYNGKLVRNVKPLKSLRPGDVYITSEYAPCIDLVAGVIKYIYILSDSPVGCINDHSLNSKTRYIAHNEYLRDLYHVPKYRLIRPYLSPLIIDIAKKYRENITKYNISTNVYKENHVLIDSDVPAFIHKIVKRVTLKLGGSQKVIRLLSSNQIIEQYKKAKIIVDWCMRGSERCPLEATLFGVVSVTNNCSTGSNSQDFPILQKYIINGKYDTGPLSKDDIKKIESFFFSLFDHVFRNYDNVINSDFEMLKNSILEINSTTMSKETSDFLEYIIHS